MGLALYVLVIIFPHVLQLHKRKTHVKIKLFPEMSIFRNYIYLKGNIFTYICDGQARCGLPAYNTSKPGLVLDDAIGNSHLSAKGWQKEDELKKKFRQYYLNWSL